ncbi:MAG TPA: hypothetical protein VEJ22_01635 [Nitrospirota bacterium]|nr:hypothetical protein [Nitrospirota bacterium]
MAVWKCNKCGNAVTIDVPPDLCPSCKERCEYVDVTCYIPECGGPESGNVNTQVFKANSDPDKA